MKVGIPRCPRCLRRQRMIAGWLTGTYILVFLVCLGWPVLAAHSAEPDAPASSFAVLFLCLSLGLMPIFGLGAVILRGIWRRIYVRRAEVPSMLNDGWRWGEGDKQE